jgi:hypothetical protein
LGVGDDPDAVGVGVAVAVADGVGGAVSVTVAVGVGVTVWVTVGVGCGESPGAVGVGELPGRSTILPIVVPRESPPNSDDTGRPVASSNAVMPPIARPNTTRLTTEIRRQWYPSLPSRSREA